MIRDDLELFFVLFVLGVLLLNDKGEWDLELVCKVVGGNDIIKVIVCLQSLVKILYQFFLYVVRLGLIVILLCNIYDLYDKLIKLFGVLLCDVVMEDLVIRILVLKCWIESFIFLDGVELLVVKFMVVNSVIVFEIVFVVLQVFGIEVLVQFLEFMKLIVE